jgi:hypothetical protein
LKFISIASPDDWNASDKLDGPISQSPLFSLPSAFSQSPVSAANYVKFFPPLCSR